MRILSRTSVTLTAAGSVIALTAAALTTTTADAASPPSSKRVLVNGAGPVFQIARKGGVVYYADGGAGTINKVTRRGPKVVGRFSDVSGVEFSRNGKVMAVAHGSPGASRQQVTLVRRGKRPVVADMLAYETRVNPDRHNVYGITSGPSAACKAEAETPRDGFVQPVTYRGMVDSHPYQLAALRGGAFAVAESGGNAILRVSPRGRVSTIAVLPAQSVQLSPTQAANLGAPSCAGETYAFEPVPTDVERGANGSLLVTTLPGGPEDPSLGARGSVYRITKRGAVSRIATGFLGATNLATYKGRVYVTELFAGKITKFGRGGRYTRANVPGAVSVEVSAKQLFIGTANFTGPSQVLTIPRT